MIAATPGDQPLIAAFLRDHLETSMFALANLTDFGMAVDTKAMSGRSMRFWLNWRNGKLSDVLGLTGDGMILPQCPTAPWAQVRVVLAGQSILGVIGEAAQVAGLRQGLGLKEPADLSNTEPRFHLDLADMTWPNCTGYTLHRLDKAPHDLMCAWRAAYKSEIMPLKGEDVAAVAASDVASFAQRDSHRVLFYQGQPVAMTGFNAQVADAVQIGGVYTPPDLRGHGYARRAVALHLLEARATGITRAILFAASEQASRAYQSLGFVHTGSFSITMSSQAQVIHV